jgi:hypothetical protein
MLRIPLVTAREMLTHGDAKAFRLLPEGAKQLTVLDAMHSRGSLWYQQYREFSIRREDMAGLEKWAERNASAAMNRIQERSEQKKPHELEV